MEENILKLYDELDKEKSVNSMVDFSQRRAVIISQFVEKIAEYDPLERYQIEPYSCNFCNQSFFKVQVNTNEDNRKVAHLKSKRRSFKQRKYSG